LSEYFLGEDKRYFTEFTFGVRTATGDTEGEPESRG
jgi:tRNA U55 pseudouridine synthase TruB